MRIIPTNSIEAVLASTGAGPSGTASNARGEAFATLLSLLGVVVVPLAEAPVEAGGDAMGESGEAAAEAGAAEVEGEEAEVAEAGTEAAEATLASALVLASAFPPMLCSGAVTPAAVSGTESSAVAGAKPESCEAVMPVRMTAVPSTDAKPDVQVLVPGKVPSIVTTESFSGTTAAPSEAAPSTPSALPHSGDTMPAGAKSVAARMAETAVPRQHGQEARTPLPISVPANQGGPVVAPEAPASAAVSPPLAALVSAGAQVSVPAPRVALRPLPELRASQRVKATAADKATKEAIEMTPVSARVSSAVPTAAPEEQSSIGGVMARLSRHTAPSAVGSSLNPNQADLPPEQQPVPETTPASSGSSPMNAAAVLKEGPVSSSRLLQKVPMAEFEHRVVEQVRQLVQQGEWSVTVRLIPEHLGELRIEVRSMHGDVAVRLIAQNAGTQETLETHAHTLREALQREGISTGRVEVTAGFNGSASSGTQGGGGRNQMPEQFFPAMRFQNAAMEGQAAAREDSKLAEGQHSGALNLYV